MTRPSDTGGTPVDWLSKLKAAKAASNWTAVRTILNNRGYSVPSHGKGLGDLGDFAYHSALLGRGTNQYRSYASKHIKGAASFFNPPGGGSLQLPPGSSKPSKPPKFPGNQGENNGGGAGAGNANGKPPRGHGSGGGTGGKGGGGGAAGGNPVGTVPDVNVPAMPDWQQFLGGAAINPTQWARDAADQTYGGTLNALRLQLGNELARQKNIGHAVHDAYNPLIQGARQDIKQNAAMAHAGEQDATAQASALASLFGGGDVANRSASNYAQLQGDAISSMGRLQQQHDQSMATDRLGQATARAGELSDMSRQSIEGLKNNIVTTNQQKNDAVVTNVLKALQAKQNQTGTALSQAAQLQNMSLAQALAKSQLAQASLDTQASADSIAQNRNTAQQNSIINSLGIQQTVDAMRNKNGSIPQWSQLKYGDKANLVGTMAQTYTVQDPYTGDYYLSKPTATVYKNMAAQLKSAGYNPNNPQIKGFIRSYLSKFTTYEQHTQQNNASNAIGSVGGTLGGLVF